METARVPAYGQHAHCEACFRTHCCANVDASVSCATASCRLLCGAHFHLCKEEEHRLLCPNETVPCLNAAFGCPLALPRRHLVSHLQACPASVVCCSLDWNRWPTTEADGAFCHAVMGGSVSGEALDLAMALRDQRLLFRSLKMATLFPELTEAAEDSPAPMLEGAIGGSSSQLGEQREAALELGQEALDYSLVDVEAQELTQEEREALAKSRDVAGIDRYRAWESMFAKELRGCRETGENQASTQNATDKMAEEGASSSEMALDGANTNPRGSHADRPGHGTKMGLAPWQEGVLERLGKEVNIAEYNMYLVHHGSMLIRFGQLTACTPKEKDFVYGSLEPVEVKTICTFTVPASYTAKRDHLRDPSTRVRRENKAVDTSDLGVLEEDVPKWDEIQAVLLCSLERELRGHPICETVVTDGLFVNLGTQTYSFSSEPFKPGATLADVSASRVPALHVQIQTEPVTRRHNKACSAFTFLCGQAFRRDEFASHFQNMHLDVQSGLNGWFEQRCPLAYLGCTYFQKRFQPSSHRATVKFDPGLGTFALRPEVPPVHLPGLNRPPREQKGGRGLDSLSKLPFEVLQHIAAYLDSFSLSQLSLVSQLMRDVCATLLKERGMVFLKWEKKIYSHGGSTWKCRKKVWRFSSLSSAVERWRLDDVPSMAEHLKACPFYEREERSEPVALASVNDGWVKRARASASAGR